MATPPALNEINNIRFAGGPSFHFELFASRVAGEHFRGQQYWTSFAFCQSTTKVAGSFSSSRCQFVLELKEPSIFWDDVRQLKVGKEGTPFEGPPLCEGCAAGIC